MEARGKNLEHLQKVVFLCWSFLEVYIFATTYQKAFIVGPKGFPTLPYPLPIPHPTSPRQLLYIIFYLFSISFLAHLSRRLTGELIGYPWIRPPWEGGTKVCINGPGHMTKMAAMPIYGKNLKKSFSPEPEVL